MKKVLVITDNEYLYDFVRTEISKSISNLAEIDYMCSLLENPGFKPVIDDIESINLKKSYKSLISKNYDLIISLHCKQLFPKELIKAIRCVNIHPGFNPYNRGWYPQVFSIINKLPLGVTIHEIDEEIDHGAVIVQEKVPLYSDDTSLTAYNRVLEKEKELITRYIPQIISGNYSVTPIEEDGNLNLKTDFKKLCALVLSEQMTLEEAIDRLRALTHGGFKNAFFYDSEGHKIYVSIQFEREQ